jgi:hypothetical protein
MFTGEATLFGERRVALAIDRLTPPMRWWVVIISELPQQLNVWITPMTGFDRTREVAD